MLSKDTPGTRHAGGWLVLGSLLLIGSMLSSGASWSNSTHSSRTNSATSSGAKTGTNTVGTPNKSVIGFPRFEVDVNRADVAELSSVPGIGPKLAQRIVEYRTSHGPFQSLRELQKVRGVGPRLASTIGQAISAESITAPNNSEQVAATLTEETEFAEPEP